MHKIILTVVQLCMGFSLLAQQNIIIPNLTKNNGAKIWDTYNREAQISEYVHFDAKLGDGFLMIKEPIFANGKIELDIRGKDEQGRSFVGVAFHGMNDSTFDAVYFRPFNFKNPDNKGHSVQYVAQPKFPWYDLRSEYPEKYENELTPVPEPDDWFHVTIQVNYPEVQVFVNNSSSASLTVEQLSSRKKGWIGFWVGNNSEGEFKNLKITLE